MIVSVHVDIKDTVRDLDAIQRKQVPFAASVALNRTAILAQADIKAEMARVFENPKPYTLGGTFTRPSNKSNLTAIVGLKDQARGGRPPAKYLLAEVTGGPRRTTGYEHALTRLGALPAGMRAIPAAGAKIDRYGNMHQGQLTEIIGALSAGTRVFKGRGKRAHAAGYFVALPQHQQTRHLEPGLYYRVERNGESAILPVLIFTKTANYKPRLSVVETTLKTVQRRFQGEFGKALQHALSTAR